MVANKIQRALGGANADDVNHFLKISFLENYKKGSHKIFPFAFSIFENRASLLPSVAISDIYIAMMGELLAQRGTHFCRQSVPYFSHKLSAGKTTKHSRQMSASENGSDGNQKSQNLYL